MKNYILILPFLFLCTNLSAQTYTQHTPTNYDSINSENDSLPICINKKENNKWRARRLLRQNKRRASRLLRQSQNNELITDVIGEFLVELTKNMKRKRQQNRQNRQDGTQNYQRRPSN